MSARVDMSGVNPFLVRVRRAADSGLTHAAIRAQGLMREGMARGARLKSSPPGTPPNRQTSDFANRISFTPSINLRSSAGTNVRYGMIQERGGTITARGKKLLVPVNPEARRMLERGQRPAKVRFISRPGRDTLMVGVDNFKGSVGSGKSAVRLDGQPVFVLKRQVTLPARPWASPVINNPSKWAEVRKAATDEFAKHLKASATRAVTGGRR